jgi:hypothetical protein
MPREIITCQIGPFSNWAGAHFWNTQDDARHPVAYDPSGDPVYEDEQADTAILYRSHQSHYTPRLIACDMADAFGNLSSAGGVAASQRPLAATAASAADALSWGGRIAEVVRGRRDAHPFAEMMHAPHSPERRSAHGSGECDGYSEEERFDGQEGSQDEEEYDDDDDDETDSSARRRFVGLHITGRGASERGSGNAAQASARAQPLAVDEEEFKAAAFDFEGSVQCWSDYLQAHLHPRSIAPLKPHAHNYSSLKRFPDGAAVVEKEEDSAGGPVRSQAHTQLCCGRELLH